MDDGIQAHRLVFLIHERVFGECVSLGAYYSLVRYTHMGLAHEVMTDNRDFVFMEDEEN